jgi:hypothetical protein
MCVESQWSARPPARTARFRRTEALVGVPTGRDRPARAAPAAGQRSLLRRDQRHRRALCPAGHPRDDGAACSIDRSDRSRRGRGGRCHGGHGGDGRGSPRERWSCHRRNPRLHPARWRSRAPDALRPTARRRQVGLSETAPTASGRTDVSRATKSCKSRPPIDISASGPRDGDAKDTARVNSRGLGPGAVTVPLVRPRRSLRPRRQCHGSRRRGARRLGRSTRRSTCRGWPGHRFSPPHRRRGR